MPERLLTPKHLEHAKPDPERDIYLLDGGGLYARVLAGYTARDKRIVFQYRYKIAGRTRYLHCGTYPQISLAEARQRRDAARKQKDEGLDPVEEQRRLGDQRRAQEQAQALEKTVRGLFEDWERRYLKDNRKDGGAQVRETLENDVLERIGEVKAKQVTKGHIVEIIDRIVDRGAKRKANMVLSHLKQMFAWGVDRGIVERDPTQGLQRKHAGGKEAPRERNLSREEIAELAVALRAAQLPVRLEAAVWILLATGARVGELTQATWTEFDLKAGTWIIPAQRTKNGREHLVHLSRFAVEWLERLRHTGEGELLFAGRNAKEPVCEKWLGKCVRDRQRSVALSKRSKRTGVLVLTGGEWHIHDLRRTMASRMGDLGIAPHVIEKCLNHTLDGILKVYQHQELLPQRKSAYSRWGAELGRLAKQEEKQAA